MRISEIFYSLQGESSYAGYPFIFVRTAGCPLRCSYCDSVYAQESGEPMTVEQVAWQVRQLGFHPVLLTGGEPLLQPDLHDLIRILLGENRTVLLETGGSLPIGEVDPRVVKVVDIKCPGSGQADKNCWSNLCLLSSRDEVKFVICHEEDYRFSCEVLARYHLADRCGILFSAAHGHLHPQKLAAWILRDHLPVRLQIQLHKFLWPDTPRGV